MGKKTWTEKEIEILDDMYKNKKTDKEIEKVIHKTTAQINTKIMLLGLSKKYGNRRNKNDIYDLTRECGIIIPSNSNKEFYFDLEDYDKIRKYKWTAHKGYLESKKIDDYGNSINIMMHRVIMNVLDFPEIQIDHKTRKRYDNRKSNLRQVTPLENAINHSKRKDNTSGISGVFYNPINKNWRAHLYYNKEKINLGSYKEKEEAIKIRLQAEFDYYGYDISPQRHLFEKYGINKRENPNE